jgi:purine-nucleoside phosphorylase
VLGSGLAAAVEQRIEGKRIPYAKLGLPRASIAGHPGYALAGRWAGCDVLVFAGRVHLYQGYDARAVTAHVRLAAELGIATLVVTNAAGGLNPAFEPGDLMLLADQINLTGTSPIDPKRDPRLFVDMNGAYAEHLRERVRAAARAPSHAAANSALREGIYAGLRGPAFETPAEAAFLRSAGADAVGMSTVLETIAARTYGLEVLGISVITNVLNAVAGPAHGEVLSVAAAASERLAEAIESALSRCAAASMRAPSDSIGAGEHEEATPP